MYYPVVPKERHEAVVRRTIERSQKPKQRQNRWSWGGALHNRINNTGKEGGLLCLFPFPTGQLEFTFLLLKGRVIQCMLV